MKKKNVKITLISTALSFGILCNVQAQSNIARIIPDGIRSTGGLSPTIFVYTGEVLENVHPDDWDSAYTAFWFALSLWGGYAYIYYVDLIGSRTFFVNENDVFSWEKIKSGVYEELDYSPVYNFEDSQIVYLGIYSGTSRRYDKFDGCFPGDENYWRYPDPLFGWVKLKFNDDGSYTFEDCALGYKCKGIIIGTEELIVPTISYQIKGQTMTLTYSDSLYESADGQTWTKVTDAEKDGTYTVDISKNGMKLYCSIMDDAPSR